MPNVLSPENEHAQTTQQDSFARSTSILYHIGYRFPEDGHIVRELFSDISVVLLCGTPSRAAKLARATAGDKSEMLLNYCRTDRFTVFRPTPRVLVASHGIGLGSIDCLLQDIYHMLLASGVTDWLFLRVGSSGGVGVPPGTIVVSRRALNSNLQPDLVVKALGKEYHFPGRLSNTISNHFFDFVQKRQAQQKQKQLLQKDSQWYRNSTVVLADTLCAETFFDAQGRVDGVKPPYTNEERKEYLLRCFREGVRNIEMESLPLAAFAARVGLPALVVSAVFVDRLKSETPTDTFDMLSEFENRCVDLVVQFVLERFDDSHNRTEV